MISRECANCIPDATFTQPFAVTSISDGFLARYDLNGNMTLRVEVSGTQRITCTQQWDAENRLSVVTNTVTGRVTRFFYDGDGNRVKKQDASGTTVYVGAYFEKNVIANIATSYYPAGAGGQRIVTRSGQDNDVYPGLRWAQPRAGYLHGDHLGSTSLATDAVGAWFPKAAENRHKAFEI